MHLQEARREVQAARVARQLVHRGGRDPGGQRPRCARHAPTNQGAAFRAVLHQHAIAMEQGSADIRAICMVPTLPYPTLPYLHNSLGLGLNGGSNRGVCCRKHGIAGGHTFRENDMTKVRQELRQN